MKLTDEYTATMQKIIQSQDAYEKKQKEIDRVTEQYKKDMTTTSASAASGIGVVTAKIGGLIAAAYLGKKALSLMFDAIKTGAQQKVQKNTFEALVGNDAAGDALYNYTAAYAKRSALGREDLSKATTSFLSYTKDINQIEKLNKFVERLYAKDPTQGAEGAVFALKELLSGDTMSIKDRFNMSGISGEKIRNLANSGDINGTIVYLDQVFNKFGATQEVVDKNFTSLLTQTNIFTSNLKTAMGDEASPAVQNLSLVMQQLNSDMSAGKFQPFFNLVANGCVMIANGLAFIAQNAGWLIPVIGGVVTAVTLYNTAMNLARLYTEVTGATVSILAGNWVVAAAIIAGAAATIGLAASLNTQNDELKQSAQSLTDAKNAYSKSLTAGGISAKVPVEISNKDPIKVSGSVDIEEEKIKYLLDIAKQKFFASFSTATLAPQVNIYGQTIEKTTDLQEVKDYLTESLTEMTQTQADGAYA